MNLNYKSYLLSLAIILNITFIVNAQDNLIERSSLWKYLDNGTRPDGWQSETFNDALWKSGNAELGYGENDESTVISFGTEISQKYITSYFRKTFSVNDPSEYSQLLLNLKSDDGAVIYINGLEVLRDNMPSGVISNLTLASAAVANDGQQFVQFTLDSKVIKNGQNTIAVEIHQNSPSSSDLSFDLSLIANKTSNQGAIIEYFLVGGVTETTARASLKTNNSATTRWVLSENSNLSSAIYSNPMTNNSSTNFVVQLEISNLKPNTQYYYGFEVNGTLDNNPNKTGKFRTFLINKPFSFHFALASCANSGSSSNVFDTIAKTNPLFYCNTGDLFYGDIAENNINLYRENFKNVFTSPSQSNLYRNTSFIYTWDDHDFGPNNSDASSPSKMAAITNYKEIIPSYPQPNANAIYQAFTVGRIRFICTDLRSQKVPSSTQMMGSTQLNWFKNELMNAKNEGLYIAWISSVPFISDGGGDASDNWASYKSERTEIADYLKANNINDIFILSGDAHMLAIDDGTNSDYSTGKDGVKIPVFQAAALDRSGSYKGGPYSLGAFQGGGQFGIVEVIDNGNNDLCINFRGRNKDQKNDIINYKFCKNNIISSSKLINNDKNRLEKLKIFPSHLKSGEAFQLEYNMPLQGILTIEIIDLKGNTIYQEKNYKNKGKQTIKIQSTNHQSGIYHVLIKNDTENISQKIIIE